MNFIERVLHISPDGGSGSFESLLVLIPVLVVAVSYLVRRARAGQR